MPDSSCEENFTAARTVTSRAVKNRGYTHNVEIVGNAQYEILTFIRVCNQGGYAPTSDEVMVWQENSEPRKGKYHYEDISPNRLAQAFFIAPTLEAMRSSVRSEVYEKALESLRVNTLGPWPVNIGQTANRALLRGLYPKVATGFGQRKITDREPETVIGHLVRLTWLSTEGPGQHLRLTALGQALLREADQSADEQDDDGSVMVLNAQDPIAYASLIGRLSGKGPALLVDPFLHPDSIGDLLQHTEINRLLMNTRKPDNVKTISVMLNTAGSLNRMVELRSSDALHDRWIVPDSGGAFLLGASLNGIGGRSTTILCPMPSKVATKIRKFCERWWNNSTEQAVGGPPGDVVEDEES